MTRAQWDRISRLALLGGLLVILYLFVSPARSYFATRGESHRRAVQIAKLERQNAALRARRAALLAPQSLVLEARKLGMVRPGERAYVVKGLPAR